MKALKILSVFLLAFVFVAHGLMAQNEDRGEKRARILKAKKAYIQENMTFTDRESDSFWAIYDAYHTGRHDRITKKRKDSEGIKSMTDAEAEEKLATYIEGQRNETEEHIAYLNEIKSVLGAKRVLQLRRVERSFNSDVFKSLKSKKKGDRQNSNE